MKKKAIRRVFGALLVIAALVVYFVPSEPVGADATASTIDFRLDGDTLEKYTGTAATVSIPSTVKKISNEAFADNATLTSVVIPDSVEEIAYAAFSGCSNLSSVVIPDSVEEIGTAAFCNCSSLTKVTIGKNVEKMGTGVFTGCGNLSEVSILSPKFVCENGVILDKDREKIIQVLPGKKEAAYSMPNTVKNIYPYSFYGCSNLNSVTLSSTLEEIPAYSFSNCNGLNSIIIPYSVNNIDAKAFENCVNLSDAEIPESVSYISKTAFDGCPKVNFVTPTYSYAYKWFAARDKSQVNIIDSEDNAVEADNSDANSQDISGNETETVDPTVTPTTIEDVIDSYISAEGLIGETIVVGRKAVVFINNTSQTVYSGNENPYIIGSDAQGSTESISDLLSKENGGKGLSLPKFAILDDKIASKAFYSDKDLTSYTIGEGIKTIGDFAFARSGLTKIEIPEGVTKIGYGAFYHCDNLSEISVPKTVTDIEPAAFSKTPCLENWMKYGSGDYLILGDGILVAYRGKDSKITIPEGVKKIGPEAFMDHKGITDLILPDSLEIICEDAFSGCTNLKSISGGINLVRIEDRAFNGCPVENIRIVDTVKEIGLKAFDLTGSLRGDDTKAVIFLGDDIPSVSYNKTASRLANSSYREDALKGVKVAIIKDATINLDGSILDNSINGFSGLICVISQENNEYYNGKLEIVGCTLSREEAENFSVPSTMIVFGKGYNFDSSQLEGVLEKARVGEYEAEKTKTENPVSFEGSDAVYDMSINMDTENNQTLLDSYKRIYGEDAPANIRTFSITVRDVRSDIDLTKFGRQTLNVVLEIPANIPSTNIHVVSLDDDGQLEDLSYKTIDSGGKLSVSFDINHTGKYGLYSYKNTTTTLGNLDESPDTGDFLSPKLFLSLGLLFAGLALIVYKKK